MRAALAQIAPRLADVPANLDLHERTVADARAAGADLVVFPELSLTGYGLMEATPDVAVRLDGPERPAPVRPHGHRASGGRGPSLRGRARAPRRRRRRL
jgi:predicted amidohydrolase